MKLTTLLIIFLLLSFTTNAQINPKTKWGEVSQAEIDYKQVPFEKEADAVILYEEGKTSISNTFNNTIYRRIKILNEKGIEFANQEILYYSHKNLERIGYIKAQTINIENGVAQTYPVAKNDFYDANINEYYSTKKFTFPNVKVGSIIEFEYSFRDDKLYMIDAWRFQHDLPTLYSKFKISNDSSLDYISLMIGDKIVNYSKQKDAKQLNEWALINLPSFKTLSFLYNPEDMAERIVFQLKGYYGGNGSAFGGSSYKDAIGNWKDLSKEMEDDYNSKANGSFVKNIANSIANGKDEKETLQNIYNYFKDNYKWNRYTAIHARLSNRELEKEKNGNVADLNLMLNTILKEKGFNAEMVLLSSRTNGKIVTSYPYLGQFNIAVNMITLSDGYIYLIDASDLDNDLSYMPLRNYNHIGFLVNTQNESFVSLNPPISEFHSIQVYNFKDGKLNLVRNDRRNGYFKIKNQENQEGTLEYNPLNNSLDVLMNEKKKDEKEDDEKFQLTKTLYESENALQAKFIGIENPLKDVIAQYKLEEDDRERPLEFNFPFYYKTDVIVNIPDGYKVEIPNDFKSHHELKSKEIIYFQNAEIKDNKLIFHIEFYMKKSIFSEDYKEIKSFFEKSNLDASKTILLKKI